MSKFNLRLKELRQQTGLTQQALADDLGISKSSVNMYERAEREPGLDLLETIANVFGVSVDYLVGKSTVGNCIRELRTRKGLTQEQLGEMDNIEIGKRIRQAREKLFLSQEDLGRPLGLNKSTIQRYESGKVQRIKLPILENIAKILNVNPSWIILKTDDPTNYDDVLIANIPEENVELTKATTAALVGELKKREGVKTHIAEPYADLEVKVNGPAIVLVITD